MSTILVTGGTGFVGSRLVPELQQQGYTVYATYHSTRPGLQVDRNEKVTWIRHTLGDSLQQHDWLHSVDTIVHLAGLAHKVGQGAPAYDQIFRANVTGTEQLARDAVAVGVKQFVFVSTIKVHGEFTNSKQATVFTEDSPCNPQDDYAKCKAEAERVMENILSTSECTYITLRPPLIYGPGVKANFLKLIRLSEKAWPLPLASLSQKRSMLFVDNLVSAIIRCIQSHNLGNQALVLKDVDVSTPELITSLAAAMQKATFLIPVPEWLLGTLCRIAGLGAQYDKIAMPLLVDDANSRELLGWTPRYDFEEGVRQTVAWYQTLDR